jgi:hypothetical protein
LVSNSRVRWRSSTSPGSLLVKRILFDAGGLAIRFKLREFAVQLIEEAGNVHLLRAEALAGGGDDVGVEADALGGLDSGRRAGNAEPKLVVGRERHFVHASRGVEDAIGVGGVDLERGVMRGDERPGTGCQKMAGDGDGERRAFFGIGGGAKLVKQDQRLIVSEARETVEVGDVRGKGGEFRLDRLRIADVGQKRCEDGEAGCGGGNRQAGLRHHCQQGRGFERDGFAAGVGTADDELTLGRGQLQR